MILKPKQSIKLFLPALFILLLPLSHEFFVVIPSDAVHRLSLVCAQSNCTLRFILCGTCHTDQSWSIDGSLRGLHSLPLCLWQLSLTHLLSNELRSLCLSSDADLCRSNAGSCILDESLVCIYPFTPTHPPPFFSLSTLPLSLSSFFLRRHFNMYANGLRSTGKICAESCPAVRRCRRDCVCIYEAWALRLMGEKMLRVVWWRLCSAGRMQICQYQRSRLSLTIRVDN